MSATRFQFLQRPSGGSGPLDLVPLLPAELSLGSVSAKVTGLVDSGATFSVLPFDIGNRFGQDWRSLPDAFSISSFAARTPAKLIRLWTHVAAYPPIKPAYAWVQSNTCPVLFGQMTFLLEFDVYLCRRHSYFEIEPATP